MRSNEVAVGEILMTVTLINHFFVFTINAALNVFHRSRELPPTGSLNLAEDSVDSFLSFFYVSKFSAFMKAGRFKRC